MQRSILASSLICLALVAGSGCATGAGAPDPARASTSFERQQPLGPGAVFATLEQAAIDGLWLAHREARESGGMSAQLARGGTVFPAGGGFSYTPLVEAEAATPGRVPLRLRPQDVAHFHTYPSSDARTNRANETHSPNDRLNVDVRDPLRRPSFVLTPSGRVQRYDGQGVERLVARIDGRSQGLEVAQAPR